LPLFTVLREPPFGFGYSRPIIVLLCSILSGVVIVIVRLYVKLVCPENLIVPLPEDRIPDAGGDIVGV
jgi:hypothetical protein